MRCGARARVQMRGLGMPTVEKYDALGDELETDLAFCNGKVVWGFAVEERSSGAGYMNQRYTGAHAGTRWRVRVRLASACPCTVKNPWLVTVARVWGPPTRPISSHPHSKSTCTTQHYNTGYRSYFKLLGVPSQR